VLGARALPEVPVGAVAGRRHRPACRARGQAAATTRSCWPPPGSSAGASTAMSSTATRATRTASTWPRPSAPPPVSEKQRAFSDWMAAVRVSVE
jgi:hypothetical protein